MNFIKKQRQTSKIAKTISKTIALVYLGSSLESKKYGLQMLPN
jgi:hypothetical protein